MFRTLSCSNTYSNKHNLPKWVWYGSKSFTIGLSHVNTTIDNQYCMLMGTLSGWWLRFNLSGIYIYGSVSKPCTPVVHIKIAGKWMFIPLKMVLNGINRYWSIAMSIGIIITGRGGINKIFDTMNQRDSSFVALCPVASLMFASQWLMKHILNHPALAKTWLQNLKLLPPSISIHRNEISR